MSTFEASGQLPSPFDKPELANSDINLSIAIAHFSTPTRDNMTPKEIGQHNTAGETPYYSDTGLEEVNLLQVLSKPQENREEQSAEQLVGQIATEDPLIVTSQSLSEAQLENFLGSACAKCIRSGHEHFHKQKRFPKLSARGCVRQDCNELFARFATQGFNGFHPGFCVHSQSQLPASNLDPGPKRKRTRNSLESNTQTSTVTVKQPKNAPKSTTASLTAHKQSKNKGTPIMAQATSLDLETLRTYEKRDLQDGDVQRKWHRIGNTISTYDMFVRGVTAKQEIRSKLQFLDDSTPFFNHSIVSETESYGRDWHTLQQLRSMFNVSSSSTLFDKVASFGPSISRMTLSPLLRGLIAYLLYQDVFTVVSPDSRGDAYEEVLKELVGEQVGSKVIQYCRLRELENESFGAKLEKRAQLLANLIYDTVYPICKPYEEIKSHNKHTHFKLLYTIAKDSYLLKAELEAYEGKFSFIRPEYGAQFEWDVFAVENAQEDAVQAMDLSTREKQLIEFVFMPAIQRKIAGVERNMTYAKGVVRLREPYVDHDP